MNNWLPAGRVIKPFGEKGEVIVTLYDSFSDNFQTEEEPVFVKIDSLTVPLFFDHFQRRGQNGALVRFADFDTESRIAELLGKEFFLPDNTTENSSTDELFWEDLIGFEVDLGSDGKGVITDLFDNDLNPLIEIEIDGVRDLIPAVDDFIRDIDPETHCIRMELPEGLLGLNAQKDESAESSQPNV